MTALIENITTLVQPDELDKNYVAGLLVASFRLSRGTGLFQRQLLNYVAYTHHGVLSAELIKEAEPIAAENAYNIFTSPHHYSSPKPGKQSKETAQRNVGVFADHLQSQLRLPKSSTSFSIGAFSVNMILADRRWVPGYRKQEQPSRPENPKPYRSNLVDYGLLGRSTGFVEFNEVFEMGSTRVKEWCLLEAEPEAPLSHEELDDIVAAHLKTAPEDGPKLWPNLWDQLLKTA